MLKQNNFDKFQPLFLEIDKRQKENLLIAIDGNCAAGKSTLAAFLKSAYGCNVFSTDDFFLKKSEKTKERLSKPGGNVDHERFLSELIKPLVKGIPFEYRAFDCKTQKLTEPILINPTTINVIEGVYCMRPEFINVYDIKVFLSIDEKEQKRRLMKRNPAAYERYVNEWIPLEEKYFEAFAVKVKCDFVF